jgi:hypothetical protein
MTLLLAATDDGDGAVWTFYLLATLARRTLEVA